MKVYYTFLIFLLLSVTHTYSQLDCTYRYEIELDQTGNATLFATDLVDTAISSAPQISLDGISYYDSINISCIEEFQEGFIVYAKGFVDGTLQYCTSTIIALSSDSDITLYTTGEALLYIDTSDNIVLNPTIFVDSVSRNCGAVKLEVSPAIINLPVEGSYDVTIIAYSQNDTVQEETTLVVKFQKTSEDSCYHVKINNPVDMTYINVNGSIYDLLPSNLSSLDSLYLASEGDSILNTDNFCSRFLTTFSDLIMPTEIGYKILRTWKVTDSGRNNDIVYLHEQEINFINEPVEFEYIFKDRDNELLSGVIAFQDQAEYISDVGGIIRSRIPYIDSLHYSTPLKESINIYDVYALTQLLLGINNPQYTKPLHWTLDVNNPIENSTEDLLAGLTSFDQELLFRYIISEDATQNKYVGNYGYFPHDWRIENSKVIVEYTLSQKGDVINGPGYCCDTTVSLAFTDLLLNKGEQYTFDLKLQNPADFNPNIMALELNLPFNHDSIEILDIQSQVAEYRYNILDTNRLKITIFTDIMKGISKDENLFTIRIRSNVNSVLSKELDTQDAYGGIVFAGDNYYRIGLKTSNQILNNSSHNNLQKITIYPNPTTNYLYINDGNNVLNNNSSVKIYDATGRLVMNRDMEYNLDVSMLNRGIYFIQILHENKTFTRKVLIE